MIYNMTIYEKNQFFEKNLVKTIRETVCQSAILEK